MNRPQIFAQSIDHIVCLMAVLVVIAFTAYSANAQSTDINNPTRLTSTEISGSFDGDKQGDNYFYSFTAGPGELVITFSLKGPGSLTTSQYSVAVLDENSKELGSKFITAGGGNSEQQVLRANVPRKQVVLLRIRILAMIGGGTATYRLRVSGAIALDRDTSTRVSDPLLDATRSAEELERQSQGRKTDKLECLPKQGTLIVKMKDGSKKIIDLNEAETITVVP